MLLNCIESYTYNMCVNTLNINDRLTAIWHIAREALTTLTNYYQTFFSSNHARRRKKNEINEIAIKIALCENLECYYTECDNYNYGLKKYQTTFKKKNQDF